MFLTNFFSNILFKSYKKQVLTSILNDSRAIFTDFGNDVYMSDFVNNCIDRIASEVSKIEIVSVIERDDSVKKLNDDITRLFRFKPNPLQSTKDFLSCCEWLRRKDYNCFIYPQYEYIQDSKGNTFKKYTAFYPLNPTSIEIGTDDSGNVWEIKFTWKDGGTNIIPYDELIHLRWRRGKNTLVGGGDDSGNPDTRDLLRSVTTIDKVIQGLPQCIEASLKIKAIYAVKSLVDKDKLKGEKLNLEEHLKESKSGIIATDLGGELKPFNVTPANIPTETLEFLKAILRERYGISAAILSGDYNGDQHSAFYQNCIEDIITEIEQAMSAALFTQREQDVGHRIKCYYKKVAYLSTQNKIEIAKLATATGAMTLNQVNEMFGVAPFEGGDRRLQSLNYVNTNIVDQYQLKNANKMSKEDNNGEKEV